MNLTYRIISDSSCDLPDDYFVHQPGVDFTTVPLKINIDDHVFVDDNTLDVGELLKAMKASKTASSTACPSPGDYADEFRKAACSFAVTISSQLSASYNSALLAKKMIEQEDSNKKIHVVDSLATSSMQMLLIFRLKQLIQAGADDFAAIVEKIESYRKELALYFILQNFDNLIKAGRMSKTAAALAGVLSICPICGEDGAGHIKVFCKVRGVKNALKKMVEMITERMPVQRDHLIIAHCNNPDGAHYVAELARQMYRFAKIDIFPMRGLASFYANDQGIIIGF